MTSRMAKELTAGIKDSVEDLSAAFKRMALIKETPIEKAPVVATESSEVTIKEVTLPKKTANNNVQYTLFDLLAG
jgi:hypothetical protein